jgi:AraC-like DNA-binding protein
MNAGTEKIKSERSRPRRTFRQYQHIHPVYHVVLYSEGEADFSINGKLYKGNQGVLSLSSPGEPHCFCINKKSKKLVYRCFSFLLENTGKEKSLSIPFNELLSLYSGINLRKPSLPVKLNDRQYHRIGELIERIAEEFVLEENFSPFSRSMAILELLSALVHEIYLPESGKTMSQNIPLARTKEFIEKNFNNKLSIRELARSASLSPGHFIRIFKKIYKTSPIDYQLELKINAAKSYLVTTEEPLKEIARRTGFNDVYYFSKAFKKNVGIPPSLFRSGQKF